MFQGTVSFRAAIEGGRLKFDRCAYDPHAEGVSKVEIEAPEGNEVRGVVHLGSVPSREEGRQLAWDVIAKALNRLAFKHIRAIQAPQTTEQISEIDPPPSTGSVVSVGAATSLWIAGSIDIEVGLASAEVRAQLEAPDLPAELRYGLFCSALRASSVVERFLLFYHILLLLRGDTQGVVDSFIKEHEPGVKETPTGKNGKMETVFTRLRNQIAHKREGVTFEQTRQEMAEHVGGIMELAKKAIELSL